jgi:DNA invertase Pin-like site-specific DNA recombinase
MSKFLLHLFAAFAEMEREIIRAGVRNAKAKGTRLARPQRVFRRDEVVRLRSQGMSWRKTPAGPVRKTLNFSNAAGGANTSP